MKALLHKDCYVLLRQMKFLLVALLLFAVIPTLSATAFSILYVIMLPVTTLAYDERCHWDQLAAAMPYSIRQLVGCKYLQGYLGAACIVLLSLSAQLLLGSDPADSAMTIGLFLLLALILLALILPVMIRLGSEKGRLIYMLAAALSAALAVGLQDIQLTPCLSQLPADQFLLLLAAVAIVLNAISFVLSVHFYQKRRG